MRALVYDAAREFSVKEVPAPEAGPGHIRIKVTQSGVCGTDLHIHEGQFMATFPLIPGHETVGVVDQLGDGVTGFEIGEQVTANPNASCGICEFCRAGRPLMCDSLTCMGVTIAGAFAEYVAMPAGQVFSVEGMPADMAVLVEPTSCAAHGISVIQPRFGSRALVLGAGPTGLLLAQLVGAAGASHVTVAAPEEFKLATARNLGIDATFTLDRDNLAGSAQGLLDATNGAGYDIVIDATGAPVVMEKCVPLTRSGGTTVFYGVADEKAMVSVSPYEIFRRELTIKGSFAEINSFPDAIAALRTGRARVDGMITHRFGLDDYGKALQAVRDGSTSHKVVITPWA